MVGDRHWEDIFGARRLGMIAIKVNQGSQSHETLKKAFEKASKRKAEISFFLKRHTKDQILKLMEPDYSIPSLGELEKTVSRIEKSLT